MNRRDSAKKPLKILIATNSFTRFPETVKNSKPPFTHLK